MKNNNSTTHVSIIGSCVCRDTFSITEEVMKREGKKPENEYIVDRFIQSINPLSAISKPLETSIAETLIEESKYSTASNFYKRCFMLDVTKTWLQYLAEVKSDYLIIDFSTVRLNCHEIENGYLTYEDLGWKISSNISKNIQSPAFNKFIQGKVISISDFSREELKDIYTQYLSRLLKLYSQKNIIVIDAHHCFTFVDPNCPYVCPNNLLLNHNRKAKNPLIDMAYQLVKEIIPNAYFIDSLPVLVGNMHHKWGIGGLHYVDEVYLYFYNVIDTIIHSNKSPAEINTNIQQLRDKYTKIIFENYLSTVTQCLQKERNLLDYSLGMTIGKFEQNGVTLVINSDYSFSLYGTATQDTVFYLYHAYKNPLSLWKSVKVPTLPGRYIFSTQVKSVPDNFYIQMVLTDEQLNKKWISGNLSSIITLDKPYDYRLVRAVIHKDCSIDVKGLLTFEKTKE